MQHVHTMITAHSGCEGTPDNSAEHVETALTIGADAFEVDINIGASGLLYLRHDRDPKGIYQGCLTLEQVFQRLAPYPRVKINCDLKSRNIEELVVKTATNAGIADQVIFSGSVSFDFIRNKSSPEIVILLNIEEIFGLTFQKLRAKMLGHMDELPEVAKKAAEFCRKLEVDIINVPYPMCTDSFIEVMERNEIGISAWTVNEPEDIRRLLDKGVSNITTRRPLLAMKLRSTQRKVTKPMEV